MPQVHGPLKKNPTIEKLIFRHLQKRGHPLSMKQEKINFSIVDIFFMQVARVARGGDAAPSFHPKAPFFKKYEMLQNMSKAGVNKYCPVISCRTVYG